MKKILNIAIVGLSLSGMISCDDTNSKHQKYLDEGANIYIGIPDIVEANPGKERIQLIWKLNSDPKIKETIISWNFGEDSVVLAADRSDTVMRHTIDLPEGKYIFELSNRGMDGDISLSKSISSESFGSKYMSELLNRPIILQEIKLNGLEMHWGSQDGCIEVDFRYLNNKGVDKILKIGEEQSMILLTDYVQGGEFSYTSLYVPAEGALDTLTATAQVSNFPILDKPFLLTESEWTDYSDAYTEISNTGWDITTNSEESGSEITNILGDGFWHCSHSSPGDKSTMPYIINLDMKAIQNISSIELDRRTGTGATKRVDMEYSTDNTNWKDLGAIEFTSNDNNGSMVLFSPAVFEAQNLRLTIPKEGGSHEVQWATLANLVLTTPKN